jgi:hypothetical protein
VVERVVTREVTRWPWWLALILLVMAGAWWRSHGKAVRLREESDTL